MTNLPADIEGLLPSAVSECVVNDPFITLLGRGWSLNINTRWRLTYPGEVIDSNVDSERVLVGRGPLAHDDWLRQRAES